MDYKSRGAFFPNCTGNMQISEDGDETRVEC